MCDRIDKGVKAVHELLKLLHYAKECKTNIDIVSTFRENISYNYDIPRHVSGKDKTSADFNGKWKSKKLIEIEKASGPVRRSEITDEHIIPLNVSVNYLVNNFYKDDADLEKLAYELSYCLDTCAVTKGEDNALTAAGLRTSMPEGWEWGDGPFARYSKVGIDVLENIKKQDVWTIKIWYENKIKTEELTKDQIKEKFQWSLIPDAVINFDGKFHTRDVPGMIGFQILGVESKRV